MGNRPVDKIEFMPCQQLRDIIIAQFQQFCIPTSRLEL